jgi:Ca2+-binding EF-hand superfamily protein
VRDASPQEDQQAATQYYEIGEMIGEGGFGKVHLARHKRTGEQVAIKVMKKENFAKRDSIGEEIEYLKMADHPNTVRYYEALEDDDNIFLVMENCSGGSLKEHINTAHSDFGTGVDERDLARIAVQLLQGVAYCHAHGVAHRDVKPQNLLFSCGSSINGTIIPMGCTGEGDARLKLVDFGIAGVVRSDRPDKRLLTRAVGTVGYMAPEVFGSRPYNGRAADMFSVGAVLHEVVTGARPEWQKEQGVYHFPGKVRWRRLTRDAQSLLEHLLHPEPSLRPTALQALQHPWVQACVQHGDRGMFENCFKAMKDAAQRSKLQRVITYSMVAFAPLHNHCMEQLAKAFLAAYSGSAEGISCFEFVELGRRHTDFTTDELRDMFVSANCSGSGSLSYCEWLAAGAPLEWFGHREFAQRAFESLDVTRSGSVGAADLSALLPEVFNRQEIEAQISALFPSSQGQLRLQEFCECAKIHGQGNESAPAVHLDGF